MREECLAEGFDTREPGSGRHGRVHDILVKFGTCRVNGCHLELLLRLEVGKQAALAHSDMVSESGDRKPFQAFDCGQLRSRLQNGLAGALAVGSVLATIRLSVW